MIWVSCEGENPADQEYVGPIRYSPWQGFPAYYFPYMHTPGYLPPIVAVQFDRPECEYMVFGLVCLLLGTEVMERFFFFFFPVIGDFPNLVLNFIMFIL